MRQNLMATMENPMKFRSIKINALILAFSSAFVAHQAFAEDEVAEDKKPWSANIEFGYVATSGNTETTTVNGGFEGIYEIEKWKHTFNIKSIFGSSKNDISQETETNAERYFIQGKSDYKYSEDKYGFVLANYDDDRFSDNNYQASVTLGAGFKFETSKASNLELEAGVGYRTTEKRETIDFPKETIDETIFRLAGKFIWDITENSKFEQRLSSEIGDVSTVSKSYTGVSANLAENLALKFSVVAIHQSVVREGTKNLDTITAFTVVYDF